MKKVPEKLQAIGTISFVQWPVGEIPDLIKWAGKDKDRKAEAFSYIHARRPVVQCRNMIMYGSNIGFDLIVQRLLGTNTYTLNVNYGVIGTGVTAVTHNDTQLTTETNRTAPSFTQNTAHNEAVIQFFFSDAILSNATYYEFGMVIDGTASVNTGQLFNRSLLSPTYAKTPGTDTTVEADLTFS